MAGPNPRHGVDEAATRSPETEALICKLVAAASQAYRVLLRTEFSGRSSMEGQFLLVSLRDSISKATGMEPQLIQETHEALAAEDINRQQKEG